MTDDQRLGCTICRSTTSPRRAVDPDALLFDIECPQCGVYRIGELSESAMPRQSENHKGGLRRLIQAANARGNRYCINDGREIEIERGPEELRA